MKSEVITLESTPKSVRTKTLDELLSPTNFLNYYSQQELKEHIINLIGKDEVFIDCIRCCGEQIKIQCEFR